MYNKEISKIIHYADKNIKESFTRLGPGIQSINEQGTDKMSFEILVILVRC